MKTPNLLKMRKSILLLGMMFFLVPHLTAQENNEQVQEKKEETKTMLTREATSGNGPKITQPENWNQMNPGASRVNPYTGTIGAEIFLCAYEDADFKIPVSLVYSSNGFMPRKSGKSVGLDWGIQAGGFITREVKGIPDDKYSWHRYANEPLKCYKGFYYRHINSFSSTISRPDARNCNYFWAYSQTSSTDLIEAAPDIFHFNFGGHQGSFMLGDDGEVRIFNTNLPHGEYRVDMSQLCPKLRPDVSIITVTTGDATKFIFEGQRDTNIYYGGYNPNSKIFERIPYSVTWVLKEISVPNGNNVTFTYMLPSLETGIRNSFIDYTKITGRNTVSGFYGSREDHSSEFYGRSLPPIQSIRLNNNMMLISFIYSKGLLTQIRQHAPLQNITLSYHENNEYPLLKQVNLPSGERYTMEYYDETITLPYNVTDQIDHWGYYSGKESVSDVEKIAKYLSGKNNMEFLSFTQNAPSFEKGRVFMLKKMTYPNGGFSKFEYEPHKYTNAITRNPATADKIILKATSLKDAGGVRIKRIASYSSPIDSVWTEYSYGTAGNEGNLLFTPWYKRTAEVRSRCTTKMADTYSCVLDEYTNHDTQAAYTGHHVEYPVVTEQRSNEGKMVYHFSGFADFPDKIEGTVESISNGAIAGSAAAFFVPHQYMWRDGSSISETEQFWFTPSYLESLIWISPLSYHNLRGRLISKKIYNPQGECVREITTTYDNKTRVFGGVDRGTWMFIPYNVVANEVMSIVETTTDLLATGQVTTRNSIKFNRYGQISEVSRSSDNGPVAYVNNQYVLELNNEEKTTLHNYMIAFNITSIPLKTVESILEEGSVTRKILRGNKNEFTQLYYSPISPCFDIKQTGERVTRLIDPVNYNGFNFDAYLSSDPAGLVYDNECRLLSSTDRNGVTTTYVWGYNHSLQVAEIVNATPEQVKNALGGNLLYSINRADEPDQAMIAALDALRVSLPDAQVTTCTYKPHVGVTSITDPSGRKKFHEYDEFYRLKRIKDDKGNVISGQEYSNNH